MFFQQILQIFVFFPNFSKKERELSSLAPDFFQLCSKLEIYWKEVTERFHENWEYWDTTGAKEPQASNFSAEVEQCCQLERKFKEEKIFINWSAFQSYLGQTYIFNYDSPLSLPPDIS